MGGEACLFAEYIELCPVTARVCVFNFSIILNLKSPNSSLKTSECPLKMVHSQVIPGILLAYSLPTWLTHTEV